MAYCFKGNTKRSQSKNTAVELRGVQYYLEANSDNISNGSLNAATTTPEYAYTHWIMSGRPRKLICQRCYEEFGLR